MESTLLILLSEAPITEKLESALTGAGAEVIVAKDRNDALYKAEKAQPSAFLCERLPTFEEDVEFLDKFRSHRPKVPVYFCGERFKLTETIRAVRMGIRGVIEPPYDVDDILGKLGPLLQLEMATLQNENTPMKKSANTLSPRNLNPSNPGSGRILRISPAVGAGSQKIAAGSGDLADRLRAVEKERDDLARQVAKLAVLKDREEEIRTEVNRIEAEKENLETERILLAQAKKKMADEKARLDRNQEEGVVHQEDAKLLQEAQAEIEDLYVQVAELKGRLKKAESSGGAENSAERQQMEDFKRDLQAQEDSIREAKNYIREREVYLDECENTIMEKSHALDEKEAEIDQLREELKQERRRIAEQAAASDAVESESTAWQQERASLLEEISDLRESARSNAQKASAEAESERHSFEENYSALEKRLSEELESRSALENELIELRTRFEEMKSSHERLSTQREKLFRNLEGLRELAEAGN